MPSITEEIKQHPISAKLQENVDYINKLIGVGTSWDILAKPFEFGGIKMMSYVTNGFFLTMNMVLILENLQANIIAFKHERGDRDFTIHELIDYLDNHIAFVQVQPVNQMADAVRFILSGPMVTFIEGFDQAFLIDTRIYPMRSISTPEVEHVIRGNHDAFTETMLMNTALVRRRLRDPRLRVELMQIGDRSLTDVSLMYLEDVVDPGLVDQIRQRLKNIKSGSLAMGEQQVVDLIGKVKWNPYPIARYTERPDVVATALMEGQVAIVVDATAQVIIAPTTFFQHLQNPNEYHSYPLPGTYMRWTILAAVMLSIFLPGIFLVINGHPHHLPHWLSFFVAQRGDPLPLWAELLVAEVSLDMLRLAVLNTPTALGSSVGIVAALLFGQFASKIQLLQPEVLVYMGFVMIAQYATTSFELASANQLARLWIMGWTAPLGWIGFLIGSGSWLLLMVFTKSFGIPYFWPLIPFRWKQGLRDVLFREPSTNLHGIPSILRKRSKA
ncbi:spore germination protein [Alicyclobacillus cycloheptanicus]|uniref:Stage V sporulation protein AF n=1 Tax=Alicyclobacillus cycloheptanicus TaxID=1457 RepID=A0ABT9XGC9_9BACL|nr:spore germination protein [Alicyclobacillus cycloheptanicus]MDQ0189315.1 stage V sporulation protein AF [Alicyclobacillus cycloheptanicus]